MTTSPINQQINTDLAALAKGEVRSWAQIGLLLDQVDHSGYWQKSSGSFTEWLKALSPSLNLKEASLWRYLTAARYYQELRKTLIASGVSIPSLDELSDKVSPENIEILSKLARVMPDDVFRKIAQQVVASTVTRAELRETWLAYRPVLEGRTARGKGVAVPKINPADSFQSESMLEAQIFTALSANGSEWTGIERPDRYELFMHVSPELPLNARQRFTFDAVAAVRAHKSAPLTFHGIEIKGSYLISRSTYELLERQTPFCDFLWVATHGRTSELSMECIPEHVGLMIADGNSIQVIRPAQRSQQSGHYTGELAKGLLVKVFAR
jgi:hypothetical protein